jgi:hypothetical protein
MNDVKNCEDVKLIKLLVMNEMLFEVMNVKLIILQTICIQFLFSL